MFDGLEEKNSPPKITKAKTLGALPSTTTDKILGKFVLASKIKSILYCPNGKYLCVGLQNGTINVYQVLVEDDGFKSRKCFN
jgi:hypothetical protein